MTDRICSIDGCGRAYSARDLCVSHYDRLRRRGDPLAPLRQIRRSANMSWEEFFWLRINVGDVTECWPWIAGAQTSGYGSVRAQDGSDKGSHVVAYELRNGPVPNGFLVRHTCDNPPCCNPAHLLIGSHADNTRDKQERDRMPIGERCSYAILTADIVREARSRAATGENMTHMAKEFGVHRITLLNAIRRKTWSHVD